MRKDLSGPGLLDFISEKFWSIPEHRQASKVEIPLHDALMSAFAIFELKLPSALALEGFKLRPNELSNLSSIFKIGQIPSDTQMRVILDEIAPQMLRPIFKQVFDVAQRGKVLENYHFYNDHVLMAMDGTGFFSSDQVRCDHCMIKNPDSEKPLYYHQCLGAVLVKPGLKTVFPLCPEPIMKQDGETKNDCERNAGSRFLEQFRKDHPRLKVILIEDGLSSNIPHLKVLKAHDIRFILGVKPGGNKTLFKTIEQKAKAKELNEYEVNEEFGQKVRKKRRHKFRYINGILLNHTDLERTINFLEYWETTEWTDPWGAFHKEEKHFSWITDFSIYRENCMILMRGGRARWKVENETFNTLKNQGYNFEHNFGHGYKNLSTIFCMMMFLVFLFDQLQELACSVFKAALKASSSTRRYLWEYMRGAFHWVKVESYLHFLTLITEHGTGPPTTNSS